MRRACEFTGVRVPILVTENGIGTDDDDQRIGYYHAALAGCSTIADGVDVRGYTAGACSTTSSGPPATPHDSAWWRWTAGRSRGRPSRAPTGWARWRGPTRSCHRRPSREREAEGEPRAAVGALAATPCRRARAAMAGHDRQPEAGARADPGPVGLPEAVEHVVRGPRRRDPGRGRGPTTAPSPFDRGRRPRSAVPARRVAHGVGHEVGDGLAQVVRSPRTTTGSGASSVTGRSGAAATASLQASAASTARSTGCAARPGGSRRGGPAAAGPRPGPSCGPTPPRCGAG